MNVIRLYLDKELSRPFATIHLPMRSPSVLDISKINSITTENVYVYDENHEVQIATVAHGCYSILGLNLRTESVFEETSNMFPLGAFPPIQGETVEEIIAAENENPRYFFTEGGTRFRIFYGETDTRVVFTIGNAAMFTNGPYGTKPGGGNYPADAEGYQVITPGRASTNFVGRGDYNIASFLKSSYEETTFKVQFVRNAVRFPGDEDTREIIIAVPSVAPTGHTYQEVPFEWYVKAYTADVFEGVKGYTPDYQPTDNNVTRGGSGNGAYPHSPAEGYDNFAGMITNRNSSLAITMGNGNGLTYYQMSQASFRKCLSFAYAHDGIVEGFKAETRRAAFVAAYLLPCRIQTVQSTAFYLADDARNYLTDTGDGYLTNRLDHIPFGEVSLANYGWDDFNDFTSTSATLLLPFVGRIGIDINAIARGTIRLDCVIDMCNGNIAYWVYTSSMQAPEPILYGVYTGNCAIQVPVTGVYAGNVLDKIINAGSSIVNGSVTGIIQAAVGLDSDIRVGKESITDTASGSVTCYQPRLDIERQEMLRAENSKAITGIPGYVTAKLNTMNGFVQVADVDVSGLTCEENEANEIRNLLKEGVYL